MNKLITIRRHFINLLFFAVLFVGCKSEIKEGKVTSIGMIPPHEESYRYSIVYFIGKIPVTQWHTAYRWIPDTTYLLTFIKVVGKDTVYREINITQKDAYKYKVGDFIQLKDE